MTIPSPAAPDQDVEATKRVLALFEQAETLTALNQAIRRYAEIPREAWLEVCAYRLRVAIMANFSTQWVTRALELGLASSSVAASLYEAPFDQWEPLLLDPASEVYRSKPDIILLWLSSLGFVCRPGHEVGMVVGRVSEAVRRAKEYSGATVLVVLPEPLQEEVDPTSWSVAWRREMTLALTNALEGECVLVDIEPLVRAVGMTGWHADRYWIAAKLPFHPEQLKRVTVYLANYLRNMIARRVKLVITDLDGTLWGGAVGEDGVEGIDLDPDGAGFGYLRLQRYLLGLVRQGVLLAVCSKNDPSDVAAVFQRRREMILQEGHFAAVEVTWDPKSVGIKRILERLRLTPQGVVFLDDHPVERAEVKGFFPEIVVPEWPGDPEKRAPWLASSGLCVAPLLSQEDRQRPQLYQAERQREIQRAQFKTLDEFLDSLRITVTPERIVAANLDRVVQLIGKTNQFNLTTRRHGRADVMRFSQDEAVYGYAYAVEDRFGPYGLSGVIIARPTDLDHAMYLIDTWILSCRVMGRRVERAMCEHLKAWLHERHVSRLVGEFVPTDKNDPVRMLLPDLGFVPWPGAVEGTVGHLYARDLVNEKVPLG